ncbi:beta-lactamase-like protein [Lipomyces arxii]|uniref:beta-lactamase-like protein n=1 Tax=Lipomyces arxii TaxID=56418 RepID=UPI0034CD0874
MKVNVSLTPNPASAPSFHLSKPHVLPNGLFTVPWSSSGPDIKATDILRSRLTGEWKTVKTWAGMISSVKSDSDTVPKDSSAIRATWLGHATYYVCMPSGLRILFDPVLGQKCALSWSPKFSRITPALCTVADLPGVDIVVISHAHWTIDRIRRQFPDCHYFCGMGTKSYFTAKNITAVTELYWWEERQVEIGGKVSTVSCLPAQHFSNRTLFDHDKTLWCSWSVESKGKLEPEQDDYAIEMPVCPAFKQTGEHRGPFNLALVPIGAYSPRWIMSRVHASPKDSVNMFLDVKARRGLAMHFGTFVLTTEPILEPVDKLKEALKWKGLPETGIFDAISVGEQLRFL